MIMRCLNLAWTGLVIATIAPLAFLAVGIWSHMVSHVVWQSGEIGLVPFRDVRAEDAALSWLKVRGKPTVKIDFEIDHSDPDCPPRARCYWYEAVDGMGRHEQGVVFTKPTDWSKVATLERAEEKR